MEFFSLIAIALDCAFVASIVGLMFLIHWIGFGGIFDLLTLLFVCYLVIALVYGAQIAHFLNQFYVNSFLLELKDSKHHRN
jgi:hypothetical protein